MLQKKYKFLMERAIRKMQSNINNKLSIFTLMKFIFLATIVFVTLYPFIYMIAVSFSDNMYILSHEVSFYPKGFNTRMYELVLRDPRILVSYKNTIIYVVIGTAISLSTTCMGAYALSKRKRLLFHKFFTFMIVFTMFFGGGLIPTFLTVYYLGLYNTLWAVVLPSAISAWNLILMRSFFQNFPSEIEESGYIDGLNDLGVFWRLVLPLSKAALSTIGLFYAVGLWNSFMDTYIYLKDSSRFPLQVILRDIILAGINFDQEVAGTSGDAVVIEEPLKFATIIVSVIPIIAVYPFLQRYFVKGIMIGSLKG